MLSVLNNDQSEQGTQKKEVEVISSTYAVDKHQVGNPTPVHLNLMTNDPTVGKSRFYPFAPLLPLLPFFGHAKLELSSHLGSCFRMTGGTDQCNDWGAGVCGDGVIKYTWLCSHPPSNSQHPKICHHFIHRL